MNHILFQEEGFAGNAAHYYDRRNSFLNDVLDRKLGIPITLSIVYMEVGRRLGLSLEGVSFPGHFLVKLELERGRIVLDPYLGGISLSEQELRSRLHQAYGDQSDVPLDRLLTSAGKRHILTRLLHNLKAIYLRKEEYTKVLPVIDRILLIRPDRPEELRDRGLIYERLECAQSALEDYRRYIELEPNAPDARDIRNRLINLGKITPPLH
jgi:regulator of sirC expression with transglutaminase-like and TPR domain